MWFYENVLFIILVSAEAYLVNDYQTLSLEATQAPGGKVHLCLNNQIKLILKNLVL